jgi:parallel beta-helix repeat protein
MTGRLDGSAADDRSTPSGRGLDPSDPARSPLVARIDPTTDVPAAPGRRRAPGPRAHGRSAAADHRVPTPWSWAGAVGIAAVAAMIGGMVAVTAGGPTPGTVLTADAMSRTVDGSWGTAPDGGAYTLAASTSAVFAVHDGVAVMDLARGTSATAQVPGDAPADLMAAAQFSVAELPSSGNGVFTAIQLRDGDGSTYQARIRIAPGGRVMASILRQDGGPGSLTALAAETPLPTRVTAEDPVRVEASITGSSPVNLSLRAWQLDQPDRVVALSAQDNAPGDLADAAPVSIWGYVSRGTAGAELRVDELSVVALAPATEPTGTPAPGPDPTPAPETTDPSDGGSTSAPVPDTTVPGTTVPETDAPSTTPGTTAPDTTAPDTTAPASGDPGSAGPTSTAETPTATAETPPPPPLPTAGPTTAAPTTTAPTTTAAPTTAAPTTTSPTTTSPTTTSPITTSPTTTSPTTSATTTAAPTSAEPPPPTTGPAPTPSAGADAGAATVGSTRYAVPAGAYFVSTSGSDQANGSQSSPWRTVAAAATRAPDGSTIVVRGGSYHEKVVVPDGRRLTIQSYPGEAVWFDGSVPVTTWQATNGTWVSTGWTAQFDTSQSFSRGSNAGGMVNPAHPMAADPQQLFVDGAQMVQVPAGTRPGPGQFAVDTAADTLTLGSDPTGHAVRASDLDQAFLVAGPLTLRGVGVQRYATPLPTVGTVFFGGRSQGSVVENVTVVDNATQGISITQADITLRHVTASRNGMTGIHGNNADRSTIVDSLVEGNNTQQFNRAPSAGGIKITRTRGVTIDGNVVRDNIDVNAIWLDESVVDFAITGNTVSDNGISYGIPVELSANGIVAGNTITGAQWGLALINSGNVQVFNNYFADIANNDIRLRQDARREATSTGYNRDKRQPQPDRTVPWLTQDITISNNVLSDTTSGGSGHQINVLDTQTNIGASAMRITITGNLFAARRSGADSFLVGWGASDNRSVQAFDSVRALQDAIGARSNTEVAADGPIPASAVQAASSVAVPVPAAVAQALGIAPGSLVLGPQG